MDDWLEVGARGFRVFEYPISNKEFLPRRQAGQILKYSFKFNVSLYPIRLILFFVLHPNNFGMDEGSSREVKRLRLRSVKIIREMHRKIK